MNIHYLQHVPFEGPGSLLDWARGAGHGLSGTRLYGGESLPDPADLDLLLVMGGPMSVGDHRQYPWLADEQVFIAGCLEAGKAVLGICLGAQLLAAVLGARVYANPHREIGWFPVDRVDAAGQPDWLGSLPDRFTAFHWHGDTFDLPRGATRLFRSAACEEQGFAYGERVIGLQFHLETTPQSAAALIRHCAAELTPGPWVQSAEELLATPQRFESANRLMHTLAGHLQPRVGQAPD